MTRVAGRRFRIGELAAAAGTTVRTLHHYEHIGLIAPASRTPGRQRRYDDDDVRRLYVVRALRDLGLSLDEVRHTLAGDGPALGEVLRAHRDRVDAEMRRLRKLRLLLGHACASAERDVASDALLQTIEAMSRVVHRTRARTPRRDWRGLGDALRVCMKARLPPSSPRVRVLAERASAWIREVAEDDATTMDALAHLRRAAPPEKLAGWDPPLFRYLDRALARAGRS